MRIKKSFTGIAAAGFLILAGCAAREEVTVVLDWSVNTNHTGLYAAADLGYFEDEGLEVDIEFPPETGAVGLVAGGTADFAYSYQEEVCLSRAAGIPVRAVAAVLQHNTSGFASRASAGIHSPVDFEGKRYGGWGSPMEDAMLKAVMSHHGADPGKVQFVSIGTMDFFMATEKEIDFVWIFEGWTAVAAGVKGIDITYLPLSDEEYIPDYYTPVIISGEKYLEKNPDTTRRFLKALRRGYEYAVSNPAEAAGILLKYAPELDAGIVRASQEFLADAYIADAPAWGVMEPSVWRNYAGWMNEKGLLDPMIDPEAAYSNEYLE